MQEIDFSKQLMHDSAEEIYRVPLGAVAAGTAVRLSLAAYELDFKKAYLILMTDGMEESVEMRQTENGFWQAEYTAPDIPGLVWYWFRICLDENCSIYYGARSGYTSGTGEVYRNPPPPFQLTVYDGAFTTPDWAKRANLYQIFPDRFARDESDTFRRGADYHRSLGRNVLVHEDWNEPVLYEAIEGQEHYEPCDYYGGTLRGIMEALDELCGIGITALYLNPIVEGASNHRYNTGDYKKVDPILGTAEDFEQLVREAHKRGIRVILDGVYSHTGDDSVYFNRYGRYDSIGAYQSKASPYYSWYRFTDYPNEYKCWWGFRTLPEVCETEPEWIDFVIEGEQSVFSTWLAHGADGFRLDVADELPDETIERMRASLKREAPDNFLLGEVWEDATTKQSYGKLRTYALGKGLDSVMNYPFAGAVTEFLQGKKNAWEFKRFLVGQSQNYPREMYYCLMNLLSSHDIARIRTVLGTRIDARSLSREQQAHFVVSKEQDEYGARLQRLAAGIQFSLPGMPCIYYGDETGMHGLLDPFNRGPYEVRDRNMKEYYKTLALLREENDAFKTGCCIFYVQEENVLGILRYCVEGKDAFGMPARNGLFLTLINRGKETRRAAIDLFAREELMPEKHRLIFRELEFECAECRLTGEIYPVREGLVQAEIPAEGIRILEIK